MITTESIIGLVVGILFAGGGSVVYNLITGGGAKTKAKAILDNAQRDAETKVKDADVAIKELELSRQSKFDKKQNLAREEVHQRERALDKRENQLNQQTDDLKKQEQFIETSQNRLRVKLEQVAQTEQDIAEVLETKRRKLHEVTGLSKEEATSRLLKLLEDDLAHEVGGRILEHEKKLQRSLR